MTIKKIIDGLYFTVGMMLFNPATGESKTPDELNEDDRYTYDACMGAIEKLKTFSMAGEPISPIKHYVPDGKRESAAWQCGSCLIDIGYGVNYCYNCGKKVRWE